MQPENLLDRFDSPVPATSHPALIQGQSPAIQTPELQTPAMENQQRQVVAATAEAQERLRTTIAMQAANPGAPNTGLPSFSFMEPLTNLAAPSSAGFQPTSNVETVRPEPPTLLNLSSPPPPPPPPPRSPPSSALSGAAPTSFQRASGHFPPSSSPTLNPATRATGYAPEAQPAGSFSFSNAGNQTDPAAPYAGYAPPTDPAARWTSGGFWNPSSPWPTPTPAFGSFPWQPTPPTYGSFPWTFSSQPHSSPPPTYNHPPSGFFYPPPQGSMPFYGHPGWYPSPSPVFSMPSVNHSVNFQTGSGASANVSATPGGPGGVYPGSNVTSPSPSGPAGLNPPSPPQAPHVGGQQGSNPGVYVTPLNSSGSFGFAPPGTPAVTNSGHQPLGSPGVSVTPPGSLEPNGNTPQSTSRHRGIPLNLHPSFTTKKNNDVLLDIMKLVRDLPRESKTFSGDTNDASRRFKEWVRFWWRAATSVESSLSPYIFFHMRRIPRRSVSCRSTRGTLSSTTSYIVVFPAKLSISSTRTRTTCPAARSSSSSPPATYRTHQEKP